MKSLEDYQKEFDSRTIGCKFCGAEIEGFIEHYEHSGGYVIEGFIMKQWLYVTCWKCRYEWALHKLGIR